MEGRMQIPKVEAPAYYLAKLLLNAAWKWMKLKRDLGAPRTINVRIHWIPDQFREISIDSYLFYFADLAFFPLHQYRVCRRPRVSCNYWWKRSIWVKDWCSVVCKQDREPIILNETWINTPASVYHVQIPPCSLASPPPIMLRNFALFTRNRKFTIALLYKVRRDVSKCYTGWSTNPAIISWHTGWIWKFYFHLIQMISGQVSGKTSLY